MATDRKWVRGMEPATPLAEAGTRALRQRLAPLWGWWKRAGRRRDHRPENVHQLRVTTRRVGAAIDAFQEVLPPKRARKLRRRIRALRRQAGARRDLDVLLGRLEPRLAAGGGADDAALLRELRRWRRRARKPLLAPEQRVLRRSTRKLAEKVVTGIRWRGAGEEPSAGDFARACFEQRRLALLAALSADLGDPTRLHALRVEGKRLRYSLELFGRLYPRELRRRLYADLREMQDRLGRANDHTVAAQLLARLAEERPELAGGIEGWITAERRAEEEAQEEFRAWWTPERSQALLRDLAALTTGPETTAAAGP